MRLSTAHIDCRTVLSIQPTLHSSPDFIYFRASRIALLGCGEVRCRDDWGGTFREDVCVPDREGLPVGTRLVLDLDHNFGSRGQDFTWRVGGAAL